MTYAGSVGYLEPYVGYGMRKNALFLGISPQFSPASSARSIAQDVADGGYQGVMVWAPNAFLDTASASAEIVKVQVRGGVDGIRALNVAPPPRSGGRVSPAT